MPNILIVGAGAVGQAYGFHLQRGGAQVTYYVREKYRDSLVEGMSIHCLSGPQRGRHIFTEFELCSTLDEVMDQTWDQVWLCISSPALYGEWLAELVSAIGEAAIIMLQPGINDYAHVTTFVPAERVVYGMITLASFQAPLANDDPVAMTWWFPPLSAAPFTGKRELTMAAVKLLRRGGMRAKHVSDIIPQLRIGSGVLMPLIAALEVAGWKLAVLRQGSYLNWAGQAARVATQLSLPGKKRVMIWLLTQVWVLRLILRIAPIVTPFNLEAMLKSHFVKVGDQTRAMLRGYIDQAAIAEIDSTPIASLLNRLESLEDHR